MSSDVSFGSKVKELARVVLEKVDVVDVVSEHLSLKRIGKNYFAVCPFHSETRPSFAVSPEKQIFKCFGCGISG